MIIKQIYGLTGMTPCISGNEQHKSQGAEIFLTFRSKETIKRFRILSSLHEPGNQAEFLLFRADEYSIFLP